MYKVFYLGEEKSPLLDLAQKNALAAALTLIGNAYKEAAYADYIDILSTKHDFKNHIYIVSDYPEDAEAAEDLDDILGAITNNTDEITDGIADASVAIIGSISGTKATSIIPYNITMTLANTEYSQLLPAGTKSFSISFRDGLSTEKMRIAFVTGKVAGSVSPYQEITGDSIYFEEGLNLTGVTIYFACSAAAKVAQIIATV